MPTSTLCGDPVDPENPSKEGLYQHELDPRHRYTLTSIRHPYPTCVGFARRRVGRGGRVVLDRVATPLDDLWPTLPFHQRDVDEEKREIENQRHRNPKEITTDYHTSGKYPWRHAFRRHLSRNPHLWTDVKPDVADVKPELDFKFDVKLEPSVDLLPDIVQDSEKCKVGSEMCMDSESKDVCKSDTSVRTMEGGRKRSYSDCSDSSYDSDQSLLPVEQEFERFIDEVNKKWLHFRPKTPIPSPPPPDCPDEMPLSLDTAISVEVGGLPSLGLGTFTTSEFTLGALYPEIQEADNSGTSLDISGEDLLPENFTGLTEEQMDSILSCADLTEVARPDVLDLVDGKDPFLLHGQGARALTYSGRHTKTDSFGSSHVRVAAAERDHIYCAAPAPPPAPPAPAPTKPTHQKKVVEARPAAPARVAPPPVPAPAPRPAEVVDPPQLAAPPPAPQPIQPVNQMANQIRVDKRKKEDTIEEVQLAHGVQLKTVQTKHSPLKKHIITSGAHRVRSEPVAVSSAPQQQILAQAVSDSLKVRLQNHLLSSQGGVLVQNGPFPQVVSLPVQSRENVAVVTSISSAGTAAGRQRAAGAVGATSAGAPLVVAHSHLHPSKLKVLHATPLTHTQRTQLLAQNRGITQLPAVVSLATLSDPKSTALFKAAPGSVAQLFEIKSGQLGKGPHLVNVVRQPQPGKATIARLDLNDKKRQLVFDGTLKGNIPGSTRAHRVSVSLEGRHVVRAPLRHQIQLKGRGLGGAPPTAPPPRLSSDLVANLLNKNVQIPKGAQKIAISGPGGQALSANVQAIAFTTAQLKARQTRLITQPRPAPVAEIVDASTTPVATSSQQPHNQETTEETETNGTVRRRTADNLPMEVT